MLWSMDRAFAGGRASDYDEHGLLTNLETVADEGWSVIPPGGVRSIADIVEHVGECKFMYENHAFGDGSLTWDDPFVAGSAACSTLTAARAWLQEAHARLRRSIASLDDAELLHPRMTNWGEAKETRWIISVMIQHDLYHAGEINHIRSQCQQTDRWAYDQ